MNTTLRLPYEVTAEVTTLRLAAVLGASFFHNGMADLRPKVLHAEHDIDTHWHGQGDAGGML